MQLIANISTTIITSLLQSYYIAMYLQAPFAYLRMHISKYCDILKILRYDTACLCINNFINSILYYLAM